MGDMASMQFLSNIRPPGWLYRITMWVKYNMLLAAAVHVACFSLQPGIVPEKLSFEYANKSTVAGIVFILINFVVSYRKKFKNLFALAAASFQLVAVLMP